jgi:hypothetical protein
VRALLIAVFAVWAALLAFFDWGIGGLRRPPRPQSNTASSAPHAAKATMAKVRADSFVPHCGRGGRGRGRSRRWNRSVEGRRIGGGCAPTTDLTTPLLGDSAARADVHAGQA